MQEIRGCSTTTSRGGGHLGKFIFYLIIIDLPLCHGIQSEELTLKHSKSRILEIYQGSSVKGLSYELALFCHVKSSPHLVQQNSSMKLVLTVSFILAFPGNAMFVLLS